MNSVDKTRASVGVLDGKKGVLFDSSNDWVVGVFDGKFPRPAQLIRIGAEDKPMYLAVGHDFDSVYRMQRFVSGLMSSQRLDHFRQEGLVVSDPNRGQIERPVIFELNKTANDIAGLFESLKAYGNTPEEEHKYRLLIIQRLREIHVDPNLTDILLAKLEYIYDSAQQETPQVDVGKFDAEIHDQFIQAVETFLIETVGYKDGQEIYRPKSLVLDASVMDRSEILADFLRRWQDWMAQDVQHFAFSLREILNAYEEATLRTIQLELSLGNRAKAQMLMHQLMREKLYVGLLEEQKNFLENKDLLEIFEKLTQGGFDSLNLLGVFLSLYGVSGRRNRGTGTAFAGISGVGGRFLEPIQAQVEANDNAIPPNNESNPLGGIQFNPNEVRLIERGTGTVVTLPDIEALKNLDFDGLVPVILNMQPVSIPALLGLQDDETADEQKAKGSESRPQPSSAVEGDEHAAWLDPRGFYLKRRGLNARAGV